MSRTTFSTVRALGLGALLLGVAACGGRQDASRAAVEYKGTNPQAGSPAAVSPQVATPVAPPSGGSGIVSYQGYQAAIARQGETVAGVADRVGLSASELAAYNGLTPEHQLRAGDELVLPPRPGGYGAGQPAQETGTQVAQANPLSQPAAEPYGTAGATGGSGIEAAPLETAPTAGTGGAGGEWSPDLAAAAIDRWQGFD